VIAALTPTRLGDMAQAKALLDELTRTNPNSTVLKLYWIPVLKAAIELNRNNPAQAIVLLEAASPYELGQPPPIYVGTVSPAYLRGQAQLTEKNGTAAALEFKKMLGHRGVMANFPRLR
jgi:eukaryotic-like serine/threonine-protein kinase